MASAPAAPPRLSIIVPVYNPGAALARCLDSILAQQMADFELICIDDGSTDDSWTTLENRRRIDPRIRLLRQANSGQAVARNQGIDVATGEFIGFCDADDVLEPEYFAVLMAAAARDQADIAMASTRMPDGSMLAKPPGVRESLAEKIALLSNGAVWDKIYRRRIVHDQGIRFPAGLIWEDNDFLVRAVFFSGRMTVVDDTHYNYLDNPNSTCRDESYERDLKRKIDALHMSQQLVAFAREQDFDGQALAELHRFIARTLPWADVFANTRMLQRIGKLEADARPRDRIWKLFGVIPLFTVHNTRSRSTWRLFGSIPVMRAEDIDT